MIRLLMGFFLFTMVLSGVELALDKTYTGPKKLTVSQLGVNVGLPHHWNAVAKKGEGLLLFQKDTNDTMRLRAADMNADTALNYLSEPHYLNNRDKIFPQEQIIRLSSRIFRRVYAVDGGENRPLVLLYVVLGPQERAVVMRISYDRANDSAIRATSMNIVQAISFTPTKQLKNALQDLEMRLTGAHITYARRDGAYEDMRELWLCSNRQFRLEEERTLSNGMSRVKERRSGRWSVENKVLILQGDDGLDRMITVEIEDKALMFDGQRGFELENHRCR